MAHHTDLFVDQTLDQLNALVTAFKFDCFRAALFHESQCILDCFILARVERSIRHVSHQQGALHRASNRLEMNQNFFQGHRHGVAVSEHDIAETVADKNYIDPSFVDEPRGWVIVRCETNQPFAALFTGSQRRCTDLFRSFRLQIWHFQLSLHHDVWTIELPVERGVWKCCPSRNKWLSL